MKAALVIMAAGMGSRYGGNKQVDGIGPNGEILMEYSIFDALRAGFTKVVFIIKPDMRDLMENMVGHHLAARKTADGDNVEVCYAYQDFSSVPDFYTVPSDRVKPFGTVHAVLVARDYIDQPFAVINADDFYGRTAFSEIYDFLAAQTDESKYAMVGYRLKNTVTEFGSVARGVCEVQNGMLMGITERTKIYQRGDHAAYTEDGAHFIDLPGDTTVSMNFWGFSPLYLRELARRFPAFLDENLPRNPLKCEYFVPSIVDAQLRAGTADVTMLHTDDAWHGVTYHDDLPDVVAALRALRDAGKYPDNIW